MGFKIEEPNTMATHQAKLGELEYGTIITGLPSHPDSFYMKVNKRNKRDYKVPEAFNCTIDFPRGCSVIMNLKSGSFRAVPGSLIVTTLEARMTSNYADSSRFKK